MSLRDVAYDFVIAGECLHGRGNHRYCVICHVELMEAAQVNALRALVARLRHSLSAAALEPIEREVREMLR